MTKMNHERTNRASLGHIRDTAPLNLDAVLRFGKHKGRMVEDVLDEDPAWLLWAAENVSGFELDTAVMDAVMRQLRR